MNRPLIILCLLLVGVLAFAITPVANTTPAGSTPAEPATSMQNIEGLGTIAFPTSTKSSAAQTSFVRGVLLLHLFEYPAAAKAFRQAEKLDPGFAMAYWGEAVTFNHPVWNELDLAAGRAALDKLGTTEAAREAKAPTAREKAYLAAVNILYFGEGNKRQRDARYATAMRHLAETYPHDNNAQLFYALALLGRSEGVRDVPTYLRAAAIAKRIFKLNPQNPGAAHYWIHGMDDPQHAAGALEAARALSKIAPDAAHAQHMTSHIFMALGMWDDVVTANENATRVVNAQARAAGKPEVECGHYFHWLEYGYFQQGRVRRAERTLLACAKSISPTLAWAKRHTATLQAQHSSPAALAQYLYGSLVTMRGTAVIESRDWNGNAATLDVDTANLGPYAAWNDFAIGYAAAKRGDLKQAQHALAAVHALRVAVRSFPSDPQVVGYLAVLDDDLRGVVLIQQGHEDEGLDSIRQAASRYDTMAYDFGPPVPLKPSHELLGEELLKAGRAKQAAAQFETVFKNAPIRTLALLGLARAQAAMHETTAADAIYHKLLSIWHAADANLPALAEAHRYLAAHE